MRREGVKGNGATRTCNARWRRLTEERARGAKSVFHFDVQILGVPSLNRAAGQREGSAIIRRLRYEERVTLKHEENIEATRRRSRPQTGGDLCPRLLEGAGEGGLLDPRATEAPQGSANGFTVAHDYVDVETAAKRTNKPASR
jgi:hypothetical protein